MKIDFDVNLFWQRIHVQLISFSLATTSTVLTISQAWSSPSLPRLDGTTEPESNPLSEPLSLNEKSWMASIIFIGAILGNLITVFIIPHLGRRKTLILAMLPTIFAYLTFAFCTNLVAFFIARICCGLTFGKIVNSRPVANNEMLFSGGTLQITPIYMSELMSKETRGAAGILFPVFITFGQFYVYGIGPLVTFKTFNLINLCFPLLTCFLLIFVVEESPFDCIKFGDLPKAHKILEKLQPGKTITEIDEELDEIKNFMKATEDQLTLKAFWESPPLRKSLIISVGLLVGIQLTMYNPILSYMETILKDAGGSISPQMSSIYATLLQLVALLVIMWIVDRFGRKILLMSGQIMITLSIVTFGTYFYLKKETNQNIDAIGWLPFLTLIVYLVSFAISSDSVICIVVSEVLPENGKNVSSMICMVLYNGSSFLVLLGYPLLDNAIGTAYTFWLFAVLCIFIAVFTYTLVPETKGKSFNEIQLLLK